MPVTLQYLAAFVFWYPLVMSVVWLMGGTLFYFKRERMEPLPLTQTPLVSILIPCYNEADVIEETVTWHGDLNYPDYEIIVISDGSTDNTLELLSRLKENNPKLRIIDLEQNAGKANALSVGLVVAKGEILVTVDADALLDKDALRYIVPHFTTPGTGVRVGAVTGNPRVRNRSSLLARIQLCEYASIVGLIKRTQRILGKVTTVSGVIAAFRKKALLDCGMWDLDMITEDIAVTWKLQRRSWDVRYEPRAICWMLVPETIRGLWRQRVRWAQGGLEVLVRHRDVLFNFKQKRLIPVYIEQAVSVIWAICWLITIVLFFMYALSGSTIVIPVFWAGAYLALVCMIQFFAALLIERRYEHNLMRYYVWAIWYPFLYWYFNAAVILRAIPKVVLGRKKAYATWESPDRGITL